MTLANDLLSGVNALYAAMSAPAVYIDRSGAETSVHAIVVNDLQQYGGVADISGKTAAISVRVSELIYSPRRGDQFRVGAKVYTVDSLITSDELEHTALVA